MRQLLLPGLLCGLLISTSIRGRAGQTNSTLRVMTFNVHSGINIHGALNLRATIELIRDSGADVIALQEVDRRWGLRSLFRDQAARLAEGLQMSFAYGAARDRRPRTPGRGEYGLAILSRFPIVGREFHLLPSELEQRGVLLAWVETCAGRLPVACTHLGLSEADRARQVAALLDRLPGRRDLLLLGDLNAEPDAPELEPIRRRLQDLQEKCGGGADGTFVHHGRDMRIDYVFGGTGWTPLNCQVLPRHASDHRPVVVDLVLAGQSTEA